MNKHNSNLSRYHQAQTIYELHRKAALFVDTLHDAHTSIARVGSAVLDELFACKTTSSAYQRTTLVTAAFVLNRSTNVRVDSNMQPAEYTKMSQSSGSTNQQQ